VRLGLMATDPTVTQPLAMPLRPSALAGAHRSGVVKVMALTITTSDRALMAMARKGRLRMN